MAYAAKIIRDSISPHGVRLTTMEITCPRIILAEFNTHRMLSRNSASSRAIPVEKRIASLALDYFEPEAFGKNQKGMSASENLTSREDDAARREWRLAKDDAIKHASRLAKLGVHKQLANRVIEPYCWHTIIVTGTEFDNYYALRRGPDAQPEIRRVTDMMHDVHTSSTPTYVDVGQWHLPLIQPDEDFTGDDARRVSVGRCARVSYLTHDGIRDPQADIDLCERLRSSGHMSPFEHVARPMTQEDAHGIVARFLDWPSQLFPAVNINKVFSGNFCGWIQFRKELPHEENFGRVIASRQQ